MCSWLYGGPSYKKDADLSCLPAGCENLIKIVNSIKSFKLFNMSVLYPCYFSEREIFVGGSADGKKIFIKRCKGKRAFIKAPDAKQEQLSFMISHRLNFGVVPPTIALDGYADVAQRISKIAQQCLGIGTVIQEGVPLHSNQVHMGNSDQQALTEDAFDQEQLCKALTEFALDQEQLCKAIFFNIVAGRLDAGQRNTVIDPSKKVMEIDNEHIGSNQTDSWLLESFPDLILNQKAINDFLKNEPTIIEDIFCDLEKHFPPTLLWNPVTRKDDIVGQSQKNIVNNFNRLRSYLIKHQTHQIRVSDLASIFFPQTERCIEQ